MVPEKERTGHIKLDDQIALTVLLFLSEHSESEGSQHDSREHLSSETAWYIPETKDCPDVRKRVVMGLLEERDYS